MSVFQGIEAVMIAVQGVILILLLAVAYRVNRIGREIKDITGQVEHYMQIVMEPETGETMGQNTAQEKRDAACDEEENRLIADVLQEIFP
jgi:hypothetical protein